MSTILNRRATAATIVAAVVGVLMIVLLGGSQAAAQEAEPAAGTVIVATKPLEPLVLVGDEPELSDSLRGYSIDVWDEVADRLGLETEWRLQETVGDILDSVATGEADVAIAGISMTAEREAFVDFAHPYYDSGLQIATRPDAGTSVWAAVGGALTSPAVVGLAVALVVLIVVVAHVIWWTERDHNPEFPSTYRAGIGEALWWSSVSIVTGGEAVKDIRRPLSRSLALIWMIAGLFLIAFVTAQAASALTVSELQSGIESIDDLPGNRVVTVDGTVGADFLADANISADGARDIETALAMVADGTYDAVVYDAPVLAYRTTTDFAGILSLAGPVFAPDPYGIALPTGSGLREPISAALLSMARDGTLEAIDDRWFGS